jgi:Flp pilus assembly protein TadG
VTMRARIGYWKDENGAGAAEFALVLLPFLALIFGIIEVSLMMYANQTLQYAAESAARCFSVNAATCGTTGATQAYAATRYSGPNIAPVFVANNTGCGHTVTGTANFQLSAVVVSIAVPLSATACFP